MAYAADRPGIVSGLTHLLADGGVNVTDLSCRLTSEDPQVYVMVAELALPHGLDAVRLASAIEDRGRELGVDVSFRPIDADTL